MIDVGVKLCGCLNNHSIYLFVGNLTQDMIRSNLDTVGSNITEVVQINDLQFLQRRRIA